MWRANGPAPDIAAAHSADYQRDARSETPATLAPITSGVSKASSQRESHAKLRSALGLHHEAPIAEEHEAHPHSENLWPRIRLVLREPLAEFWGVFILVFFGNGSVAQVLLSEGMKTAPGGNGYGQYQSISWG